MIADVTADGVLVWTCAACGHLNTSQVDVNGHLAGHVRSCQAPRCRERWALDLTFDGHQEIEPDRWEPVWSHVLRLVTPAFELFEAHRWPQRKEALCRSS